MVRSSVTSKISVVDNAVFCNNTFHWFESKIKLKREQVSLTILICLMLPLYDLLYENLNRFFPLLIVRQLPFKVKPPCLNTKELNFSGDLNLDGRLANFLKKRL